jgi:hypothetical protein
MKNDFLKQFVRQISLGDNLHLFKSFLRRC